MSVLTSRVGLGALAARSIGRIVAQQQQQQQRAWLGTIASVQRDDTARLLRVNWHDGGESRYAYAWLRDNAHESHTSDRSDRNRARHLLMADLDPMITPVNASLSEQGDAVHIAWPNDGGDGGTLRYSSYSEEWLRQRDMTTDEQRQGRVHFHRFPHRSWGADNVQEEIVDRAANWDKMMDDDAYLCKRLGDFLSYGLMFVRDCPKEPATLAALGKRIGYLLNSHYGKKNDPSIFGVFSEPVPSNLMNTTLALGLHTDFPQYQQPPEVQVLHCIHAAGDGGDSQFVDGFRVAELLKEEKPHMYDMLAKHPVEFVDWGEEHYKFIYAAKWKTIELDALGELHSIFFNNQVRGWWYGCPPDQLPKMYEALKAFNDYCYQKRNMLRIKLAPGDMVWFGNNRVMHGREAFSFRPGEQGARYLEGAYISFDCIKSKIRAITEQMGTQQQVSL